LRVAAIDRSAKASHQCGHLGAHPELAAGARIDDADAFDAAHLRGFGPFTPTHVHLGVVDPEPLDFDHHLAVFGPWLGNVGIDEAVQTAESFQDDRPHGLPTGLLAYDGRRGGRLRRLEHGHGLPLSKSLARRRGAAQKIMGQLTQ
jgi:hypothetical protein